MRNVTKLLVAPVALVCLMLVMNSCSKEDVTPATVEEQLAPGEFLAKEPKPGTYVITKFIDTGDDETAQFNGYTFQFTANGGFIATTASGQVFNGSWDLNSAETVMTLNIAGNNALDDLDDDDWTVTKITNLKIKIKANGPDIVVFSRI